MFFFGRVQKQIQDSVTAFTYPRSLFYCTTWNEWLSFGAAVGITCLLLSWESLWKMAGFIVTFVANDISKGLAELVFLAILLSPLILIRFLATRIQPILDAIFPLGNTIIIKDNQDDAR